MTDQSRRITESWSTDDWQKTSRRHGVFSGFVLRPEEQEVRHAANEAFTFKNDFVMPCFRSRNATNFACNTTKTKFQASMVESSLRVGELDGSTCLGFLMPSSINVSYQSDKKLGESYGETSGKIIASYDCPTLELVLNGDWMKLSDGCLNDLFRIAEDPSMDRVVLFYKKYGHVFASEVVLGGSLRWSRSASEVSGENSEIKETNFKASVSASFMPAKLSGASSDVEASNVHQSSNNLSMDFRRVGGKPGFSLNIEEWEMSLEDSASWDVIEHAQIRPIFEVIADLTQMDWVRDIFLMCHGLSRKYLSPSFSIGSRLYALDTDFASIRLRLEKYPWTPTVAFLFFQDPDGWIRWGIIDHNHSIHRCTNEFLFKERIARGRRRSPLAVAGGYPNNLNGTDKLELFFVNEHSQLCHYIFRFTAANWEPAILHNCYTVVSDNSDLDLDDSDLQRTLTFTGGSGDNITLTEVDGIWEQDDVDINNENDFPDRESDFRTHPLPGAFDYYDCNRLSYSDVGRPTRDIAYCNCDMVVSPILARRLDDNRIDVIIEDLEPYWILYSDENSEPSTATSEEAFHACEAMASTVNHRYEDVCTVLKGSDFFILLMKEDYNVPAPTLIYISIDGKMEMIRIEPWRDMRDRNFTHRNIFEPNCLQVAAAHYFNDVSVATKVPGMLRRAIDED